jgi:predicted nucleic acid-binding protein
VIVLDASVALELLFLTPVGKAAKARLFGPGESLHAPHLIDVEVAQVLRRYALSGRVPVRRCSEALEDWRALRVHRYPHEPLMRRIWTLRDNLTAYDAAYIALAEGMGAPLITHDAGLASAAGHHAKIELV